MSIALIPARSGSRRIPRKNVKVFEGKPIIAYSIETALATGLFERVVVSTDSAEIADIAESFGACSYFRPPFYCNDHVGTQEVVAEYLRHYADDTFGDTVCCIYATAPLMSSGDLILGHDILIRDNRDFVFSVGYPPLQDAGQFYWGWFKNFAGRYPLIGSRTGMVHVHKARVCDINTPEDWELAVKKYRALEDSRS